MLEGHKQTHCRFIVANITLNGWWMDKLCRDAKDMCPGIERDASNTPRKAGQVGDVEACDWKDRLKRAHVDVSWEESVFAMYLKQEMRTSGPS